MASHDTKATTDHEQTIRFFKFVSKETAREASKE